MLDFPLALPALSWRGRRKKRAHLRMFSWMAPVAAQLSGKKGQNSRPFKKSA
jgi:hypothetical protein